MDASPQQPITFEQVAALPSRPPDHTIAYGSAPAQFGHLRLPTGTAGRESGAPYPVVIFIHGGCYRSEYSIAHAGALEQALADSGYAVWSLEYRRVGDPGGGWPGTFQDVGRAADHLKTLASQFPLDLRRVVAAGHSAGGNLALWLAARRRIPKDSELHVDGPLAVAGVLALAPAGDLAEMHAKNGCGGIVEQLMGGAPASVPDRYRAASPVKLAPIGIPQVLVVGGRDSSFASFGRSYYDLATAAGERAIRTIEVPEAGHFDVIAPTTRAWATVKNTLDDLLSKSRK
jgi:acetyl esterase/lipase